MPARIIVDASAFGAVFFHEPDEPKIRKVLESHIWLAPSLVDYEMASIARKKALKYPDLKDKVRRALKFFETARFQRVKVDFRDVFDLSFRHSITTYDASYLWLALELDCKLLTLDSKLQTVANEHSAL